MSGATKPAFAASISRQMLTSREMRTGTAAGERFGDRDAEVFLVRGECEYLCGGERTPFQPVAEHAGPDDALGDIQRIGARYEGLPPVEIVGTCEDQAPCGILRHSGGVGVDQNIAALLGVQAAHEEQEPFAAQVRVAVEEGSRVDVRRRGCCAESSDHGMCAIEGEGTGREQLLCFTGEQDGARVTQDAVVCPWPIEPFFQRA